MIIDRLWKTLTDGRTHSEETLCAQLEITRTELAAWRDRLPEAAFDFLKIENGIWQAVFPALEIETAQLAAFAAAEEIDFAVKEDDTLLISQMVQHAQTAENIHRTVWAATGNQNRKTLSFVLAWVTPRPNTRLLSLAATLSLAKVLRRFGIAAQIVWPREIIADGQKIGKITVEESPLENGRLTVIHASADFFVPPEESGIGLWQLLPEISLPALIKSAIHEMVRDTQYFSMRGLWPFQDNYTGMMAQRGHTVQLRQPHAAPAEGLLLGIDMDGHLMLDNDGQVCRFESGTLNFRQPETVYTLPAAAARQMLLLDAGNSQIKWAWIINGEIAGIFRAPYGKLFPLAEFCRRHPSIESVYGSAVCGEVKKSQIAAQIPRRIQWLHSERTACGIRNHYHNIGEHGSDRWFNVLGARKFTQNACVIVSCGTAVTVDALTDSNQYLGGSILPGLNLMKESLAEHTANLDRPFGKIYSFSTTTPNAIASGIMDAVIGAVVLMVQRLKQRCENRTVDIVVTGGGAARIRHHFPENILVDTQVQIVDNLVIYGLLRRLEQS